MIRDASKPKEPAVTTDDEPDPILDECLSDALGGLLDVLSPEELADHRRMLTMFIKTHPAASARYERLTAGRIVVVASGDPVGETEATPLALPIKGDGTFGGRGEGS
ncbi:MAG: hypothetical protein ABJE95_21565 [Byssovorax sp.]